MCNTAQYQLAKAAELVEQSVDETLSRLSRNQTG
jgi:hypothetical protein